MSVKRPRKQTKFQRWIRSYGAPKLARELGVSPSTVRQWVRLNNPPSYRQMLTIERLTKSKIKWADMVRPFVDKSAKRKSGAARR